MGIVTQTIGSQQYLAQKADLEYKINQINQTKLSLTTALNELVNVGTDMDPNSPEVKNIEARKKKLNDLEKQLDMKLQQYQSQLQIVESNMKALK